MKNICHVCGNSSLKIFDALILGKYRCDYFQCEACKFIQTEKPYWLSEAYVSAITSIDVGLVYRNLYCSNVIPPILDMFSGKDDAYIDYGGGYGMFVRMMRDKGYHFFLHDIHAENLFAKYFELKDFNSNSRFAALTAFEVFEHLEDPIGEIEKMLALSDIIIFSTELQPSPRFSHAEDWWYFTPETGQHISFYNRKCLEILGNRFNCKLYSNGNNLHLFTRINLNKDPFAEVRLPKRSIIERIANRLIKKPVQKEIERTSLLEQDFQLYRSKVNKWDV